VMEAEAPERRERMRRVHKPTLWSQPLPRPQTGLHYSRLLSRALLDAVKLPSRIEALLTGTSIRATWVQMLLRSARVRRPMPVNP
jgi:hypothetical protein